MKKESILFLTALLFSLILSSGALALVPDCGNNTILTLYSAYNSHAAVFRGDATSGADIAICYNNFFSGDYANDPNPWACSTNKVITLSSLTNAHVSNGTYINDVCFGDLKCSVESGSCGPGSISIASLSSLTNAHITNDTSSPIYPYRICCSEVTAPTLSAQWSDKNTGLEIISSEKDSIVNLTVNTLNIPNGKVNITVYNKSNGFALITFKDINIMNNKAEISKNLSSDILMGNASKRDAIYFNASYGSLVVASKDLNISGIVISNAKWVFAEDLSTMIIRTNQTQKVAMYVDTSLPVGENLTFRIYDKDNNLLNETNVTVGINLAISYAGELSKFIVDPKDDESYSFNVSYSNGDQIKSNFILYNRTSTVVGSVYTCFRRDISEEACRNAIPIIRTINNTCSETLNYSACYWDAGTCKEKFSVGDPITRVETEICNSESTGEFSKCENGWKTLQVRVNNLATCSGGACSPSGAYQVPCRAVALLPVFSLANVMLAAGLIIIVYIAIFKSKLFNSKKTDKTKKKNR